jgi:hypothetical protein
MRVLPLCAGVEAGAGASAAPVVSAAKTLTSPIPACGTLAGAGAGAYAAQPATAKSKPNAKSLYTAVMCCHPFTKPYPSGFVFLLFEMYAVICEENFTKY